MALDDAGLLARMQARKAATSAMLGMELLELSSEAGTTRFRLVARPDFCNPMGNMQGGLITTALDDAASTAVIVKAGRRVGVPTIEMKTSFFAAVPMHSEVFASGRCLKLGRTVTFAEADLADASGRLLARLSASVLVVDVDGPGHLVGDKA
jgi:uncharacterized protein (TIGR00369 family)